MVVITSLTPLWRVHPAPPPPTDWSGGGGGTNSRALPGPPLSPLAQLVGLIKQFGTTSVSLPVPILYCKMILLVRDVEKDVPQPIFR